jgi:hypothetical protein
MYFQTGQVIFVPEWPNGEFVSILALFYVWTKSLMCKDAINRDSTFRVMSRLEENSSSLSAVPTMCHPVRTPDSPASSVWTTCFFRPDTSVSRSFCSSLIRPDVSVARPDAYQFSNGSLILSEFKKGKINQPSGRCGIPSGRVCP